MRYDVFFLKNRLSRASTGPAKIKTCRAAMNSVISVYTDQKQMYLSFRLWLMAALRDRAAIGQKQPLAIGKPPSCKSWHFPTITLADAPGHSSKS